MSDFHALMLQAFQACSAHYAGDCYFGASSKAFVTMLKSFGYHLVAIDTKGVNLFFVHASAAGDQPLLTLADAKRLFAGGDEFPMLNVLPCNRMVWVAIGDGIDYAASEFKPTNLPLVMLAHTPAGKDNMHRVFHPVKHVDVMFKQLVAGVPTTQRAPSAMRQPGLLPGILGGSVAQHGRVGCGTAIAGTVFAEGWVVGIMLAAAFMAGSMCRQLGMTLLRGFGPKQRLHTVLRQL